MLPSGSPIAKFTTNSFVENPISVIVLATSVGMGLMFVGIALGLPILLSMVLLFGGIGLVYGYLIGKVQYTLWPDGIGQGIRRFIPYFLNKKEEARFISWKEIKSFKNDTDFTRQLKEYEYLKLYLSVSPQEIWITNQHDNDGFQFFKEAFLVKMEAFITPDTQNQVKQVALDSSKVKPLLKKEWDDATKVKIKVKKSFYSTLFAKVVTIFFVVLTVTIFLVGIIMGLGVTSWFKLLMVLLPGTVYMVYRVFIKKKK